MSRSPKAEKVLNVALELLKSSGDYGLTMRKVAANAEMSLSNVQYYYKNKDELLKAMADKYFETCLEQMREMPQLQSVETAHDDLYQMLKQFLSHGLEVTEMCRIFREYWAISTRNKLIDEHIRLYYKEMVVILSEILRPLASSEAGLSKAVSVFIPYVEGYSITALAMPENIDSVTESLTDIILKLLRE